MWIIWPNMYRVSKSRVLSEVSIKLIKRQKKKKFYLSSQKLNAFKRNLQKWKERTKSSHISPLHRCTILHPGYKIFLPFHTYKLKSTSLLSVTAKWGACIREITYHAKAKNCKIQKRSASPSLRHWGRRAGRRGRNTAASKTTMQDSHFLNILQYIYVHTGLKYSPKKQNTALIWDTTGRKQMISIKHTNNSPVFIDILTVQWVPPETDNIIS